MLNNNLLCGICEVVQVSMWVWQELWPRAHLGTRLDLCPRESGRESGVCVKSASWRPTRTIFATPSHSHPKYLRLSTMYSMVMVQGGDNHL